MASPSASASPSSPPLGSWAITRTAGGIERGPIPRDLRPLKKKLISLGGERVVVFMDGFGVRIRDRGVAVPGGVPPILGALDNSCHSTSAILQLLAPADRHIMTGYALSDDGCWRRHTWVMQDGKVMEPTVERTQYFGYALVDPFEVLRFVWPEIPQDVYLRVYDEVIAGKLGGKKFKTADLVRVQRLIDAAHCLASGRVAPGPLSPSTANSGTSAAKGA